jgi:Xylanase inhibitor N-terminal
MTLLLLLVAFVSVSVDSVASGGRPLSIPLVPHHVQRRRLQLVGVGDIGGGNRGRRRRRDARSLHESDDESDDESDPDLNFHGGEQPEKVLNISDANHMQIASLYQGYGTHYADLWCGKPTAQRQTVIVDTGSGVTAFPCVGCDPDACGVPKYHLDPLFDPDLSSSYHKLGCSECQRGTCDSNSECHIGMSYQEGSSWYAFEVTDSCYVGGIHDVSLPSDNAGKDDLDPFHAPAFRFPLTFGCQTKLTGLFKTQLADGIMGMDHAEPAFWYQASNKLGLPRKFSLCFSRSPTASRQGTNAGAMTIGGTDSRLHGSEMVYSSVSAGGGFYDVTIRQVYLRQGGGESAAYDAGAKVVPLLSAPTSGIVDSGTTELRIVKSPFFARIIHSVNFPSLTCALQ